MSTNSRYIWSIVTAPSEETCKRRHTRKQPFELSEDNLHLYLDPLEDLTPPSRKSTESLSDGEISEQTEQMLISPIRNTTKQTSITGKTQQYTILLFFSFCLSVNFELVFRSCSKITVRICVQMPDTPYIICNRLPPLPSVYMNQKCA